MTDIVARLLNACNAERNKGADFPTIWKNILKVHPYVAGSPIQDSGENGLILRIPLITGQVLVFLGSNFSLL
ncbi:MULTISPECIES: hypothetical protein [unclassified Mesorhizobium]|uniref:hypothetical protein n=1 Tax=unclassified Mesorhizobium TaxID=325217 RepID=UPI000FCA65CA|nr:MULTISPECIES: hypothetical protein [unclassified Mesorhizobium]RUX94006.1 hypothetical protein EN993_17310 [Mesorhizobium sp. M7D.F.Ca.US.004.01.2.1]RVA35814.1 hypothetical protein EN935_03590 [Mesorhizobium sp. M7D.F.Ca.US.004.03.1.1]